MTKTYNILNEKQYKDFINLFPNDNEPGSDPFHHQQLSKVDFRFKGAICHEKNGSFGSSQQATKHLIQ